MRKPGDLMMVDMITEELFPWKSGEKNAIEVPHGTMLLVLNYIDFYDMYMVLHDGGTWLVDAKLQDRGDVNDAS